MNIVNTSKREARIKIYLNAGGTIIRINSIDTYRDGGTRVIETGRNDCEGNKIFYYIDKDAKTLHYDYPTKMTNQINDLYLEAMLQEAIESYVNRIVGESNRASTLMSEIKWNI